MLKYLFTVVYTDGTVFRQTPDDISQTDPKRSAFYDVLNSGKEIQTFTLEGDGHTYAVDLTDGNFYIDGRLLLVGELTPTIQNRRVIFYRAHEQDFTLGRVEMDHRVSYYIGWQGNDAYGKNYKEVIGVV